MQMRAHPVLLLLLNGYGATDWASLLVEYFTLGVIDSVLHNDRIQAYCWC